MKLRYDVPKIGNYWFAIYHIYYKNKLGMKELIYNFCFSDSFSLFGIVRMQINDILILADNDFARKKKQ